LKKKHVHDEAAFRRGKKCEEFLENGGGSGLNYPADSRQKKNCRAKGRRKGNFHTSYRFAKMGNGTELAEEKRGRGLFFGSVTEMNYRRREREKKRWKKGVLLLS